MQVIQVCIARYHHFNLARELNKNNNLDFFFTGYPKFKILDEEDIPPNKIISVPILVTPFMFFERYKLWPNKKIRDNISFLSHQHLDWVVKKTIKQPSILISFCGAGLHSFRSNKKLGGVNICDKGSTHIEYQESILKEEYLRYDLEYKGVHKRRKEKELKEYDECDLITVPSQFSFDSFLKKGIPKEKLRLIPYGARIKRFRPKDKYDKDTNLNKEFNILFVGNFGIRKGAIDILEAFKKFKHPRKKLTIVGSVDQSIKCLIQKYDTESINFLGHVNNKLLRDFYTNSEVLLFPSIEDGYGIVILEALACGCPVIATKNTGAIHSVKDKLNGFIIPIRSPKKIVDCLTMIADSEDLRLKLKINSIKIIDEIKGWSTYGNQWNELIESIYKEYKIKY